MREKDGNSALQDLMYLLTLESVVKMEKAFGLPAMGEHYAKIASAVKVAIRKNIGMFLVDCLLIRINTIVSLNM